MALSPVVVMALLQEEEMVDEPVQDSVGVVEQAEVLSLQQPVVVSLQKGRAGVVSRRRLLKLVGLSLVHLLPVAQNNLSLK